MSKRPALALAALVLIFGTAGFSQEKAPFTVAPTSTVPLAVASQTGKTVTLMLDSGAEVTGTVKLVGDRAIHLTALTGKEYYDAVVAVDKVTAVIVRAR